MGRLQKSSPEQPCLYLCLRNLSELLWPLQSCPLIKKKKKRNLKNGNSLPDGKTLIDFFSHSNDICPRHSSVGSYFPHSCSISDLSQLSCRVPQLPVWKPDFFFPFRLSLKDICCSLQPFQTHQERPETRLHQLKRHFNDR